MATRNDGGPAFPGHWIDRDSTGDQVVRESYSGMTLRDYFAAKAMQAAIAAAAGWGPLDFSRDIDCEAVASFAAEMSGAMLRARESE